MASTKLVFNEDEVKRLQSKIGQVSQDTNRLYLQLKGQSSSWGGIPMGDHLVKAQVLINELTVEAEKLEDIIRVALRGVSELQEENKQQAEKLTGQFNLLFAAFGSLGLQATAGRVSIPEFVQRSATNLITSIAALSGKDELSRDPVVQQLRNVIQTSGLLTVESIAAQSKLNDIFAARNEIAKAQMAFKVYQAFGNQAQMTAVHAQAEEARQKLASLGVAKIYYETGKDLSPHYKQPAVTACEYDPSITAEKVPLLHNEEYLLLLRLAMEKTAAGAYARSQLAAKRQEIQLAAVLKQVQEQIEAERRLNAPPLTLPDGTPITADNKENETTLEFYQAKVYVPNEYLTPMYTSYLGWLDNTYGLTKWESKVRQSGDVVLAFTEGLMKEVVMGVADTATFAFKLVVDPVKTTTEMKQQAQYLIDHPEVLVEAAKMAYHQFDEGTPEEKAKMLGSVASILVPGLQVTKAGKVGKVLGEVEDVVSQAAKDALQGIKQKLPNLGPVMQTPEGFVFKIGEIPDTPAMPKTPVQQRYMDGLEGKGEVPNKTFVDNSFDEAGKLKPNVKYKAGEHQYDYETDHLGRIENFSTDDLKLTARDERLPHDANTPGKESGDHAGHLAGDRFGGSPEIDNLVSQSSKVNLSTYKKIENEWARALNAKPPKHVTVDVKIKYDEDSLRPSSFNVTYTIDGELKVFDLIN
ncbi:DNA/RNA non-specific endonuclease [Paenibacillus silagei]|uniref:DNA-binding protein YbaB n=1 Tax=Paenibacillus silagei TaxID=1670801 RepID=A0ABS4NW95_9BACL|nr:DNA/RNA non-specific endonuclease [Paenibacillus silagei]MBP2114314.1 DNA-binding protein YbaB [Paenibacillus silagei]